MALASISSKGHIGLVISAVFSPDGQLIASGSSDGTVIIWDARSGLWQDDLAAKETGAPAEHE